MKPDMVIKMGKETESVNKESSRDSCYSKYPKVWTKEMGCQAAIKFHTSACSDVRRVNVIYTVLVACGLFLLTIQQVPLRTFDAVTNWSRLAPCSNNHGDSDVVDPLSAAVLHENIDTTSIDTTKGELRVFKPHGLAAHLYIEMGAYRGGPREFSIVGLVAKPIETFHEPSYGCEWISNDRTVHGHSSKILPDWNYGKLYSVVVLTCTFSTDVGADTRGGSLILTVPYGDNYRRPERFTVLAEPPGSYNATTFTPQAYAYDYVYCGSSIYGNVSPQRMREWLAYHAYILGPKSHFILHDAGGFHSDVWKVLEPWVKLGRVTVQNIRQQEIYDAYYHNQFLVVNDCLFRSRFMAKWTLFFDVDEYLYVPGGRGLGEVLNEDDEVTQITFEQVAMSNELCVAGDTDGADGHGRKWAMENLVYRRILKRNIRYDRKFVVQARHAAATGVHMSMNMKKGKNLYVGGEKLRYYHYHDTINRRQELCTAFVPQGNKTDVQRHRRNYHRIDESIAVVAEEVKAYELRTIGTLPFIL